MFSEKELAFLQAQPLARIATVDNDDQPTVDVVGFQFDDSRFYIGGHQLSASRLRRSGQRGGPGSADPVARRDRWSRRGRTTNTLKLPFAARPRLLPERKELLCPTQL
jgi:pyridoxamine 5'-phosphate oxidase family protein